MNKHEHFRLQRMFHYQNSKTERRLHSDMVIESIVSQTIFICAWTKTMSVKEL